MIKLKDIHESNRIRDKKTLEEGFVRAGNIIGNHIPVRLGRDWLVDCTLLQVFRDNVWQDIEPAVTFYYDVRDSSLRRSE